MFLATNTIQKDNSVIGYFNAKFDKNWLIKMTYNALVPLNKRARIKS